MKKINKMLLGLSALTLLASCGAKEITDPTKIDELKYGIALKKDEIKNYEFTIYFKETEVNKGTNEESVRNESAHIRTNEDGEQQVYVTFDSGRDSQIVYLVNDDTYEKLIYCDYYYLFNGQITVIDYKYHKSDYESLYRELFSGAISFMPMFLDPFKATSFNEYFNTNPDVAFETERKYFSGKDGQLTITIDETSVKEGDDTENHFKINYDDFAFKDGTYLHSYSTDTYVRKQEFTFIFEKKEKFSIELPNGWEKYLIQDK